MSGKRYKRKIFLGIIIVLIISSVFIVLAVTRHKQDLQVRNDVYSVEREKIEGVWEAYNVTINYPQFDSTDEADIDIDRVNALIKDAAFSMYGKTSADAITVLEEELRDSHSYEESFIDYDILQLEQDYISMVFTIDYCVGGPSYMQQYPVTIDIKKGEYIYFNDLEDFNEVLNVLRSGNFEVYAGTYSEFTDEDAHGQEAIRCFTETFEEQISKSVMEGSFDCFSSQNIGIDEQHIYIFFPLEEGISFHGYYILCVPRNLLDYKKETVQIRNVILGEGYYLVLEENGEVWILRKNGDRESEIEGNRILNNIVEIADGGDEIYALTEDGYVYVWGKEFSNFSCESNEDMILCESEKLEKMENIIDIEAKNDRMFAMDKDGCIYVLGMYLDAEYDKRAEVKVLFDEEEQKSVGKITDIVAGAGNYHYFIREDGTVFSVMQYWYEGNGAPYAFIFPNIKEKSGKQEDELYYWPEELKDIEILNDSTKEGYTIYYNLEGVSGIKNASSDSYTVFLEKEDGTLWYWDSDRIKYHDKQLALSESENGKESQEGRFVEVKISDILNMEDGGENTSGISDIQSGTENTLFLMEDGSVFISQYETYKVQDVKYYRRSNPAPERLDSVLTAENVELKQLVFKKLDMENIVGIYTDGNNDFLAIDSQGRFYDVNVTDNKIYISALFMWNGCNRSEESTTSTEIAETKQNTIASKYHVLVTELLDRELPEATSRKRRE